ncbi:insulinase family protein [Flavobacterium sp. W21_SRS_FM6]|uniref:insulinase family protein n=1 Tax=Flavobacterium sp. W21_SRS_FM6 TaxID=3240268 RepID=UPI003F9194DF
MQVLVVEDTKISKTACSATFQTGHFDDDDDCHGLSHLLEHMLFLGNASTEVANALGDFVSAHGGTLNASTGTETSSYFFDIFSDVFDDALAQFSAMLFSPLLQTTYIEKEIQAIDAEFKLKQKDDLRRLYQVHKETCNPNHPFSKFSVGNRQTFEKFSALELQKKLRRLHQRYYQSANLCLSVISSLPISETKLIVEKHFSHWKHGKKIKRDAYPALYLKHQLGVLIQITPLQKAQRLIITFALPAQNQHYRAKPLAIISHILGDEGYGGLLDYYKGKNWATSLSAGGGIEGSNFKDFNINLQLTDKGLNSIEGILSALFSYLELIKKQGVESWRLVEMARLNTLAWRYGENPKPIDEVLKLSHNMVDYPPEHVMAGDYLFDKASPAMTYSMLDFFSANNMRLKLIYQSQKTDTVARWYDTPYKISQLPPAIVESTKSVKPIDSLTLPKANRYLSDINQLAIKEDEYTLPTLIHHQPGLDLWFGQDQQFQQPKGDCFLTFDCPAITQGIEIATYKRLWVALINEKLTQKYYQANLAGLHFHLYPHQGGFSLQTNGFSAKQLHFCTDLLTQIVVNEDFKSSFEQVKNGQVQLLNNSLLNKPINRLFTRLSVLLQQYNYAPIDMAEIMGKAQLKHVIETKNSLLGQFNLEGMMYGNWSIEKANEAVDKVRAFRQLYAHSTPLSKGLVDLTQKPVQVHFVDCQHNDDAVVMYFQAPSACTEDIALTMLFEQMIATPFFNQMRTERQVGYLVGSGYLPYNQHPGIALYIQSPNFSANQIIIAMQQFLSEFLQSLNDYQEIWTALKAGLIRQLSQTDSHLSMKSQRLWMCIGNKDFTFSQNSKMIAAIEQLTFSQMLEFSQRLMWQKKCGELILISSKHKVKTLNDWQEITSISEFKHQANYLS